MTRRFTPARAGTTRSATLNEGLRPVHPRSRGDHVVGVKLRHGFPGSPPLARGPRRRTREVGRRRRFTPARAGTTSGAGGSRCKPSVHPRSRGDHATSIRCQPARPGSPPLARGPQEVGRVLAPVRRFTPARAGTTSRRSCGSAPRPVHPRSRGDHGSNSTPAHGTRGSPPLARGPLDLDHAAGFVGRFTPARAGTTVSLTLYLSTFTVHPRSRGDHITPQPAFQRKFGSPPLARGPQWRREVRLPAARFTPARAGTTSDAAPPATVWPVHPRSRGDHRWTRAT